MNSLYYNNLSLKLSSLQLKDVGQDQFKGREKYMPVHVVPPGLGRGAQMFHFTPAPIPAFPRLRGKESKRNDSFVTNSRGANVDQAARIAGNGGAGDHKHFGDREESCRFVNPRQLMADFMADVKGVGK